MHACLHLALPSDGSPVYGSSANIEMTSCIWILTRLRKHVWNATHCLVHGPGCIGQSAHLWVPRLGTRYCFSPSPVTPPSRPPCLLPSVFPLIACDRPFPFPNSFLLSSKWWKKCLAFKLILWKSFFFPPAKWKYRGLWKVLVSQLRWWWPAQAQPTVPDPWKGF